MRIAVFIALGLLAPVAATAETTHWNASVNASTSSVINGMVTSKPQFGARLEGQRARAFFGGNINTVDSNLGTDSQNQLFAGFSQSLKPFNVRYQVTYKSYPGTKSQYTDEGIAYQVTASRAFAGINYALGAEYSDEDYATTRKSYGLNASLSRSFLPKLSGWLSVSHRHQFGSVDYTNTNIGLYYQMTSKLGLSTSVNNWHAYASWAVDRPTLSVSLSRRL